MTSADTTPPASDPASEDLDWISGPWTALQLLAWVLFRRRDKVKRVAPDGHEGHSSWQWVRLAPTPFMKVPRPVPAEPPSLLTIDLWAARLGAPVSRQVHDVTATSRLPQFQSREEAHAAILEAWRRGEIKVFGRLRGRGVKVPSPRPSKTTAAQRGHTMSAASGRGTTDAAGAAEPEPAPAVPRRHTGGWRPGEIETYLCRKAMEYLDDHGDAQSGTPEYRRYIKFLWNALEGKKQPEPTPSSTMYRWAAKFAAKYRRRRAEI